MAVFLINVNSLKRDENDNEAILKKSIKSALDNAKYMKRKTVMKTLGEQDTRSEMGKPKLEGNKTSQGISDGLKVGDGTNVNIVLDKDGVHITQTETILIGFSVMVEHP